MTMTMTISDAYNSDSGATIDSSYFMEGISIAAVDSNSDRTHLFSAAVGYSYDTSYTSYNCPVYNCDYPDTSYVLGEIALTLLQWTSHCFIHFNRSS